MYNQIIETKDEVAGSATGHQFHGNGRPQPRRVPNMEEQELPPIRITDNDIAEANQLSLSCPICGNAVENHTEAAALIPVVCDGCGTLYHKACWEGSGGKCAVLGCGSSKFHIYGKSTKPVLKVKYTDLPSPSVNGRPSSQTRRLKEEQRRQVQQMTLFQRFWRWLLDQIRINP